MIVSCYFLLLLLTLTRCPRAMGGPAPAPSVRNDEEVRIMSDYPSMVPPIWPEVTDLPTGHALSDDIILMEEVSFRSFRVQNVRHLLPSDFPSMVPSVLPSDMPSMVPSDMPSMVPSDVPSMVPSDVPSMVPSDVPSTVPSDIPSMVPSESPSFVPSVFPSVMPSFVPSFAPSSLPTTKLTEDDDTSVVFEALGMQSNAETSSPTILSQTNTPTYQPSSLPQASRSSKQGKGKMNMRRAVKESKRVFKTAVKKLRRQKNGFPSSF